MMMSRCILTWSPVDLHGLQSDPGTISDGLVGASQMVQTWNVVLEITA